MEQVLLEVLEKRGIKRWGGLFQKNLLSDGAVGAICDALGKIGSQDSLRVLSQLEKSREGSPIPKMKDALKKIKERINPSGS